MTAHALALDAPQEPQAAEELWLHDEVTPTRDDQSRRTTDARRLTFPLQMMLAIIGSVIATTVSVTGAFWIVTSQVRTDIALIKQMQTDQVKIDEYKSKLEEERSSNITRAINELKQRTEMTDLKVNNLRETVLTQQRR